MKKKKKKELERLKAYISWRNAWIKRLDDTTTLDGLAEMIKGGYTIDDAAAAFWENHVAGEPDAS